MRMTQPHSGGRPHGDRTDVRVHPGWLHDPGTCLVEVDAASLQELVRRSGTTAASIVIWCGWATWGREPATPVARS